ncbi:MAG: hypothetical protein V9E96_14855 [Chitinophagaceae bacterium]
MKLQLSNFYKWAIFLFMLLPAKLFAAGPPKPSDLSNPFAQTLVLVIIILAVCIAILANVLLSAAQFRSKKTEIKKDDASNTSKTFNGWYTSTHFIFFICTRSSCYKYKWIN